MHAAKLHIFQRLVTAAANSPCGSSPVDAKSSMLLRRLT
jgi:hypothetical protein